MLDVVVIVTPSSDRADPLLNSLHRHEEIRLHTLDAVMLRSISDVAESAHVFDHEFSDYVYSRSLRPGELGCSVSNTLARKFIAGFQNGGLVLEDDARVVDVNRLVISSKNFLDEFQGISAVLSFYWTESSKFTSARNSSKSTLRHYGHPPYTVAYALTKEAAIRFVESNTPTRFLADWPICDVKYFVSLENIVRHGDSHTTSVINSKATDLKENHLGILRKVAIYSGVYFFHNKSFRFSLGDFLQYLWKPRVLFHLNQIWLWFALRSPK